MWTTPEGLAHGGPSTFGLTRPESEEVEVYTPCKGVEAYFEAESVVKEFGSVA